MTNLSKQSRPAGKRTPALVGVLEPLGSNARQDRYVFIMYVSGSTRKSALALENIKRICEQHLKNRYDLEVIDIYQQPNLAKSGLRNAGRSRLCA